MLMSSLTGEYYDENDSIRIVNIKQALFYWINNVRPLSIYPGKDLKTGEPILVFIFKKSKTKDLYKEWLATKADEENHD